MRQSNDKGARTDEISGVADDPELLLWKTWNASAGLQVVGITESDDAGDAIADAGGQVLDRAVREGGTLTS